MLVVATYSYYFCWLDIQRPRIVPEIQNASIGANVTFTCRASGRPKPNITWITGNSSDISQTKPTVQTITDIKKGQSQLVITRVTREDFDSYRCVATNSAGRKTSKAAFLYQEDTGRKQRIITKIRILIHHSFTVYYTVRRSWR